MALSYVIAAELGFQVAFAAEQVTTVWAPTGIAIAALLLSGLRLWPAVWTGAFVANAGSDAALWTAAVVATGNTLEAVAAAWALRKLPRFDASLQRLADALAFIGIAAAASTVLSATVGVATLCVAGVQPWGRFAELWFAWWLGDALGALVVAPAILTNARRASWSRQDRARACAVACGALVATHLVFGQLLGFGGAHPLEYVVFPFVIAAAVLGGPSLTSLVVLGVSAVTIWNTVRGAGPFAGPELHHSLLLLQTFLGVLAGTGLLLAAAIAERAESERRERETAEGLRHREKMLRLAQRASGVAAFEWDFRSQIAECSSEFFRIFGLPERDGVMTGGEWARFVHPDDRDRMASHLARALEGSEPAAADYRITAADGTTRWLTYAGQVQRTPGGDRMLGTVLDITDRKRMEAELRAHAAEIRESRDVLSLAMRGGAMGAWSRNLVTNEVWWSRELEQILGLEPGAFDRTEAGFFEFVHPEDRDLVREAAGAAVASGSDYIVEFRFRHAGGEWRWMEGRGRAVYTDDGSALTLYGIGIDVTARKRSEIALRDAKAAAEAANQLKDQFLATLSHELRTPLNAILGYVRMLRTSAIAPDRRERAIEVIERNAVAQNQLVEDLLDMSRITTGKVRLDPVPIPVAAVLREALEGVKPAADAKRITLDLDLDPFAGTVRADPARLQQVFWNVLSNAVKFTPQGGRVEACLRRDGEHVEASISDTGVGISPEFLRFVFEPFRQAEAGPTRDHGGLGLGLAIARQLVELHGGTIHASSDGSGQGASFVIRLPRVREHATRRPGS